MNHRIALITGTSSGFGLLTSVELAQRGYRVVATMRDLARRERLDQAATKAGVSDKIDVRALDITNFDSLPAIVDGIVRDYGRIDVLVNNAGFPLGGFAEDIRLHELRSQFETNFFGTVEITKAVLPVMRKQRSGHIIMVGSVAGRMGQPVISSYSASKFALEGWSESLRVETHSLGIRVVLVEPGAFATDIWTRGAQVGEYARSPEAPNHERAKRFTEFIKSATGKMRDARDVARLIARIADDPNPRLRYMIGRDGHMQLLMKTIMPWRIYERMVAKAVKID